MSDRLLRASARLGSLTALLCGLSFSAIAANVVFTYDAAGRVRTARYDNGICVIYSYDANGNRTAQTNVSGGASATPTWGSGVWGCFPWTP